MSTHAQIQNQKSGATPSIKESPLQHSEFNIQNSTPLTPESLTLHLLHNSCELEDLLEKLSTTAEDLAETLYSHSFHKLDQLRADLAIAQTRARAAQYLPDCLTKLYELTKSEKPEVARRALMATIHLAGMAKTNTPAPILKPPPNPGLPELSREEKEVIQKFAQLSHTERLDLACLAKLPKSQREDLNQLFMFNTRLQDAHGIDLLHLTRFQFRDFARHIDAFFHDLGIRFSGKYNIPYENSLSNPKAVQRAHKLLAQLDATESPQNRTRSVSEDSPPTILANRTRSVSEDSPPAILADRTRSVSEAPPPIEPHKNSLAQAPKNPPLPTSANITKTPVFPAPNPSPHQPLPTPAASP